MAATIARHLPATNASPTSAGGSGAAATRETPRVEAERPADRDVMGRGEGPLRHCEQG